MFGVLSIVVHGVRTYLVLLQRNITGDTYRQLLETEMLSYARGQCSSSLSPSLVGFPARWNSWAVAMATLFAWPQTHWACVVWLRPCHSAEKGPGNESGWTGWCSHPGMGCTHPDIPEQASWVCPQTHRCCQPEEDIPIIKCVFPDWTFCGTNSLGEALRWHPRLWYWHALQVQNYHFLHNFEMSTHDIKFSELLCSNFGTKCDKVLKKTWSLWACG